MEFEWGGPSGFPRAIGSGGKEEFLHVTLASGINDDTSCFACERRERAPERTARLTEG
jgi:hypothetical protein